MYLLEINNREKINISSIPELSFEIFEDAICFDDKRVISLFVQEDNLYAVLMDDEKAKLYICSTKLGDSYPAFTLKKPYLHMFEREIFEKNNIEPLGHPFLKPVRNQGDYEFLSSSDYQSHEVAVGPVHAGIIEPGHFRFICNGERVNHLEIMLGYQKRGVEQMMKNKPSVVLAESICGDSTIGYAKTYAEVMEALSNINVDKRATLIRNIALEMERLAIHIGDLGAIAGDVAYQIGANVFAVTRTLVINTMLDICGNRFGKGLIRVGGVNYNIDESLVLKIEAMLKEVKDRLTTMSDAMFSNATVLSRLENTGTITKKRAKEIGLVGMAAKASGIAIDSRKIENADFATKTVTSGDVYARTYLRFLESLQSIELIEDYVGCLSGEFVVSNAKIDLVPSSLVVVINEGWRGEIVHVCMTDEKGYIKQYKIKDPSFNNWFGLAIAVRNNQISDFPVCNKSFNLSYCGFDL